MANLASLLRNVALAALLVSAQANALELMPIAQEKSLLLLASQLSGYPIPDKATPPRIEKVSIVEMGRLACGEKHDVFEEIFACPIVGFFQWPIEGKPMRIVIRFDDPDNTINSISVHELTHWLQWVNWENPIDQSCPREFLREYQAYRTELAYDITYENKPIPKVFDIPPMECPTDTSTIR
jgi:hypothetical protein